MIILAVAALDSLYQADPTDQRMMANVKALSAITFTEIANTHKHRPRNTTFLAKLANINSPELRAHVRETPIVFLKILPELNDISYHKSHYSQLSDKLRKSYGESLTHYSKALLDDNLTVQNHYLTNALSTTDNNFNCEHMVRLYDAVADRSAKRKCNHALLKHSNIPSTLKYMSAIDKRRNSWRLDVRQNEIGQDFRVFVGAYENGTTFSVDRQRLQAFVNRPDISRDQKARCFETLPLAAVNLIAKNDKGDYHPDCAGIASKVVSSRVSRERQQNRKFQQLGGILELRDSKATPAASHPYSVNYPAAHNVPVFYDTYVGQQLETAFGGINQFLGGLVAPALRRERVDHQHREGFR